MSNIKHQELQMHFTILRSFSVIVLVTFQLMAFAQDKTRLLPETIAKTIGVEWKQDGRAVDLKFSNPVGKWVVTSLLLNIRFLPIKSRIDGEFKKDKNGHIVVVPLKPGSLAEEYWFEGINNLPQMSTAKVEIQPGKDAPSVLELESNSAVAEITILEARGREQTTFERLKSKML